MSKKYVLGIDGGTGGMRVGLYDLDGNEDKVQSLLDALLEKLTVNALPLVQTN